MRNFFSALLRKMLKMIEKSDPPTVNLQPNIQATHAVVKLDSQSISSAKEETQEVTVNDEVSLPKIVESPKKLAQKKKTDITNYPDISIRDVIDLMEFPFLALSKDRINPIIYESEDKTQKVEISGHRGHFIASIY